MKKEKKEGEKYTQLNELQEFEFAKTAVIAGNVHSREIVALKPIAENLGLSWSAVQQLIKRDEKYSQLSVLQKVVSADGKKREMLCLPLSEFQDWLWDIQPNEKFNHKLWELYKKGLVLHLINMLRISLDEIVRIRGIADEYVTLKNVVTKYINANEQGKELTKKAKEFFKESNMLQKQITERMDNFQVDQLKLL